MWSATLTLIDTISRRGHDVTVVMPFDGKGAKYKVINTDPEATIMKETDQISGSVVSGEDTKNLSMFQKLIALAIQLNENAFKHPIMQGYLKNPDTKFDIVIVQPLFAGEAGYYLGHRFKAPLATYITAQSHIPQISHAVGQPYNPSYMNFPMLTAIGEMTFFERVLNTFASFMFEHAFRNTYFLSKVNEFLDQKFPGEERPGILEIERNTSLVLQFGHPLILDGWAPMVPNYVQLGMMNCRPGNPFPAGDEVGDFLPADKPLTLEEKLQLQDQVDQACSQESIYLDNSQCRTLCESHMCCFDSSELGCRDYDLMCPFYTSCEMLKFLDNRKGIRG